MKLIFALATILMYIAMMAAGLYGYVHNIIVLINHTGDWGMLQLVRAIGIIAFPLGAVMGFV